MAKGIKKTFKDFIREAHEVHGKGTYDYSDFIFKNYSTEGLIKCKVEGHQAFKKTPNYHINKKKGCPKCSHEQRYANTFKAKCKALGINYWRALKRREAGMLEEKIFNPEYVRGEIETNPITVNQKTYPNLAAAYRALKPIASRRTIRRWLNNGLKPEEVFNRVPNPGYSAGVIYLVTNKTTDKQYVGLSITTMEERWNGKHGHVDSAKKGEYTNQFSLQTAIREHGEDDFLLEEIDYGTSCDDLEKKETEWIEKLGTLFPNGYNLNKGGVSGGANKKPKTIDNIKFESHKEATKYVSGKYDISFEAAKKRIEVNRIDIKKPSKPGEAICKTKSYKAWSQIKHSATNPNAKKGYIPGIKLCERWQDSTLFREDVGEPDDPSFVFARIDKSEDFTPENCRWMSRSEAAKLAANAGNSKKSKAKNSS